MNEQMMKERIQQALNAQMSGVRTSPAERSRLYENAIGGTKVKRKMTVGLVFAIVLVLMTAAAVATILLTHQEIVEKVAVPLAVDNDGDLGVKQSYSAEELAELVRNLNENGITLEENNAIMQALKTGKGYYEEEAIMEICRQAFGGNMGTWTLEEQDWFSRMMADIGFYEDYEPSLPGEGNLTYEQAEAYAFSALKKKYGEKVDPEDRNAYQLERSFQPESHWFPWIWTTAGIGFISRTGIRKHPCQSGKTSGTGRSLIRRMNCFRPSQSHTAGTGRNGSSLYGRSCMK